jgi:histidinol phosphatase-like PHP family hydrolase
VFRPRLQEYAALAAAGEAPPPERFISRDDVARIADAAGAHGLFVEVNLKCLERYATSADTLPLCRHAHRLLIESGADLCVGSDAHRPPPRDIAPAAIQVLGEVGLADRHVSRARRTLDNREQVATRDR